LAKLSDYLDPQTLRDVQYAFSAVAGQAVAICDEHGRPLVSDPGTPDLWQHVLGEDQTARVSRQKRRAQTSESGVPPQADVEYGGEVLGRVRFPAGAATLPKDDFRQSLLRLMAGVLRRLCEDGMQLRSRIEELLALHKITEQIAAGRELQKILDDFTRIVVDVLKAKASSIRVLSEDGSELVIRSVHSFSPQYLDKRPIPLTQSRLDQEVLRTHQPVYVADMTADPRVLYPEHAKREGVVSALCAPMIYRGKAEGILRVFHGRRYEFDWFETQLLQTLANAAAAAIVNSRLYAEARESWNIKRALATAAVVQRRMIPREPPVIEGFDIQAMYIPSYELAGDFYDFISLPQNNTGIAVCDVVGKGVRASLLMASIRAALRAHAVNVYSMADVLAKVNRDLCSDTLSSDFATLFYAVLNSADRRLTYSCAGHMPPFLARGGKIHNFKAGGGVLGVLEEMAYPVETFQMQPGDVVLAYTDGLSEAINFTGETYGSRRVEEALKFAVGEGYSAMGIARYCVWDMHRFIGLSQSQDDTTLVVIKAI
jgi:sigma-B regulation protein RsbU (phosphoserine phosphatase)